MLSGLIALLVYCLIVGIVVWIILWALSALPIPAPFNQIIRVLVIVIAALAVLMKALPLLGVSL